MEELTYDIVLKTLIEINEKAISSTDKRIVVWYNRDYYNKIIDEKIRELQLQETQKHKKPWKSKK